MKKDSKKTKRVKKTVEVTPELIETVVETPTEVAVGESEAKKELRAYIENLKATDAHEYAVREARLLKELNNLN